MRRLVTSIALLVALTATACTKGGGETGQGSAGGIKAGPGVTADTVRLGALLDLTAVFAANSKSIAEGMRLYWDGRNQAGGICGRKVQLDIQDHGYDPQKAVALYRQSSGNVLAYQAILGSPVISALLPSIQQDKVLAGMAAWTSQVLPNQYVQITGATYDIDMINGIDFLMREKGLKKGDKIGHVYFEGDYGENALKGSKYAAAQAGLTVVEQKIKPTDTDLSSQVAALSRAGVKAILLSAAGPQTTSVASVAKSSGLDVPIVGNAPVFTPQLLQTPAAAALKANLYVVTALAPPALPAPGVRQFLQAFQARYPKSVPIQNGSLFGYAASQVTGAALDQACKNKDLTRQGLVNALHSLKAYDTRGLVAGPLDYSNTAQPPTRMTYISKVNADAPGGLETVGDPYVSAGAKNYRFSGS
ncbi:MAG TPA: ABC transporter substrate-binding protein [Streptosporangiaceae bacterium]|jgi:ABC-type branched-subunit amino acid transport system substrate-binding protein